MWGMLGCTGPLALVGFALGFLGTFLLEDASLGQRFAGAGMTAAMVFFAASVLSISDMQKQRAAIRRVRKLLGDREPVADDDFAAALADVDRDLALEVRHAIATYLEVPAESIYPSDSPAGDLGAKDLEPGLHFSVVAQLIRSRGIQAGGFMFNSASCVTMQEFMAEVDRAVSEAEQKGLE